LGVLFSSNYTCPNQRNLCSLNDSIMVGFLTIASISLLVNILQFSFSFHILCLKFFYTLPFKKSSIAFYLSLLVSRFLIRMLMFYLLLCSLVSMLVKWISFYF
jgi:hypothetical protein